MYYFIVFFGLLYEQLQGSKRGGGAPKAPSAAEVRLPTVLFWTGSLVGLFLLRLVLTHDATYGPTDAQPRLWHLLVPIPTIYVSRTVWFDPYREALSFGIALIGIASSTALYFLWRSLAARGSKRIDKVVVAIACIAMAMCALFAPVFSVLDPYLYAMYGELGLRAYSSHLLTIPCPQPGTWCTRPSSIIPALYGPLFLIYVHALLGHVDSLLFRVEILRCTNLIWVGAFLFLLSRFGIEFPILALAALNEVVWWQYVGDAHNDIIGIDLLLAACIAVRRFKIVAMFLCVAAGLIKLPFIVLGLMVFWRCTVRERLMLGATTSALSLLMSLSIGGYAYAQSLLLFSHNPEFGFSPSHRLIFLTGLILIALALFRGILKLSGAYIIPTLSGSGPAEAWYALWAIPYIIWDQRKCTIFLIALPMTSFLIEAPFQMPQLVEALACVMIVLLFLRVRERKRSSEC